MTVAYVGYLFIAYAFAVPAAINRIRNGLRPFKSAYLAGTLVYTVRLPRTSDFRIDLVTSLILKLATLGEMTFRIIGDERGVWWQLLDFHTRTNRDVVVKAILSVYPNADVAVSPYQDRAFVKAFHRKVVFFRQSNMYLASLRDPADLKTGDPLGLIANTFTRLLPGEEVSYYVHMGKRSAKLEEEARAQLLGPAQDTCLQSVRKLAIVAGLPAIVFVYLGPSWPSEYWAAAGLIYILVIAIYMILVYPARHHLRSYTPRQLDPYTEKLQSNLFGSFVAFQVDTPDQNRLAHFDITPALSEFQSEFQQSLQPYVSRPGEVHAYQIRSKRGSQDRSAIHDIVDLASRIPVHDERCCILSSKEIASLWHLPYEAMGSDGIQWSQGLPVPIPAPMLGQATGIRLGNGFHQGQRRPVYMRASDRSTHIAIVGKAGTGKSNLLHHLIDQDIRAGNGVAVIDPHGKLVRDILRWSIPKERVNDVVVFDLANEMHPPPFNLLSVPNSIAYEEAAARLVTILDKFGRFDDTVTVLPALRAALAALKNVPHATMSAGKIVLMSLEVDEAKLPPAEKRLVGALLVAQFQMAAFGGAAKARPFYLYIDEVQHFIASPLNEMLSELRKYNLSLTTANQYLKQLTGPTLDALIGVVGAMIVFQTGLDDARLLAPYMSPTFTTEDLLHLDKYVAAVTMRHMDIQQPPFTLFTPRPLEAANATNDHDALKREQIIRSMSEKKYTPRSREEILNWLKERYRTNWQATSDSGKATSKPDKAIDKDFHSTSPDKDDISKGDNSDDQFYEPSSKYKF